MPAVSKACERCKAPYRGYGAICSPCRRLPAPEWNHCSDCGAYYCGYGSLCDDCKNKSDAAPANVAGEGGAAAVVPPPPTSAAASPPVRRRTTVSAVQAASAEVSLPTAEEQAKQCEACKELIGLQQCISSGGKTFHWKCFACKGCKAPLSGSHTVAPGGGRLCLKCAPQCHSCRKPVIGQITKANDNCYHPECFKCDDCGKKIVGNFLLNSNGRTLCQVCVKRPQEVAPRANSKFQKDLAALDKNLGTTLEERCAVCRDLVGDEARLAGGKKYHPACFKCHDCGERLVGYHSVLNYKNYCTRCASKVVPQNTAPACTKCKGEISGQYRQTPDGPVCTACSPNLQCAGCQKELEGKFTKVGEKSYHPACFTCHACNGSLAGGFCAVEGDYFCGGCAQKQQAEQADEAVGTCAKCRTAISGEYVDAGNGDFFHGSCFTCDGCSKALEGFCLEEGAGKRRYLCETCA